MATLTICNCNPNTDPDVPTTYRFMMEDKSGCEPGAQFYPASGSVTLARGECRDIPIKVFCPPRTACQDKCVNFSANVVNTVTGEQFRCDGKAVLVENFKVTPNDPVTPGTPGEPATGIVNVARTGDAQNDTLMLELIPMNLELASPQTMEVPLPQEPNATIPVEIVALSLRGISPQAPEGEIPPPDQGQVLIAWDDDGDGTTEVGSSITFRFTEEPCPTDLNGDGKTDGQDLGVLLLGWGPCPILP